MQRTTVSPSSSSTSRSTPWVAGCCGPMLMSICSPSRSGSRVIAGSIVTTFPPSSVASGTRRGRPCESRPVVESSTSTVRLVVAMLLPPLLAGVEASLHVLREILERLDDRQLVHRVARFRIRGQRLAQLFRTREASAKREVLSQWEALLVLLPHQNAAQVGMPGELDAEHVVALALEPIGRLVDVPHARHFQRGALLDLDLDTKEPAIRNRAKVPDDLQRHFEIAELDAGDVGEVVVLLRRIVVQPLDDVVR